MMKVLLIEDDANLAFMLTDGMESEGYEVLHFTCGEDALATFKESRPDIILLDVNLKGEMDGFEVGNKIRQMSNTPVIFTTARTQFDDLQKGFALGNVDYLKKPYSIRELCLRINALTTRPKTTNPDVAYCCQLQDRILGKFTFTPQEHLLVIDDSSIHLPKNECAVLVLLSNDPGKVVPRNDILNAVWGEQAGFLRESSLNNVLSSLRSKLTADPRITIQSILKVGCKLIVNDK